MKKLDATGSKLCTFQANIFAHSKELPCSSLVFLRRFFNSEFARTMDHPNYFSFSYDVEECYKSIVKEYGQSAYGKDVFSENVLYWLGYITRYICYTRDYPSKLLYKNIPLKLFISNYEVYHTQNEDWVFQRVLELSGLSEDDFDKGKREKKTLVSIWSSILE
jgi:hypothetical protein